MKAAPLRIWLAPGRSGAASPAHITGLTEYPLNKHSLGLPSTESPAPHSTTRWRRRGRRYLRILLLNALKGAAYTLGGTAVTWLIWWVQAG